MTYRMVRLTLCICFLLVPQLALSGQESYAWKAGFNPASSAELREIHEAIYASDVERLEPRSVFDLAWIEKDFVLHFQSGVMYLEPEILGARVGAFFVGEATISFGPSARFAVERLERYFGRRSLYRVPVRSLYLFTLRPDSPLDSLPAARPGHASPAPESTITYMRDKSALRKLGFNLTWSFLNREGPARGAIYVLFPMLDIQTERSQEARLLYSSHPMLGVTMAVFGHDTIATLNPYKYNFASLLTYGTSGTASGVADVDRYSIRVVLKDATGKADQRTVISFIPASDLRAVRLRLSSQMQISRIADATGRDLPFLQWEHLGNDPNFDQSVVVSLADAELREGADPRDRADPQDGAESISLSIESTGVLFDSRFTNSSERVTLLQDEEHWYPRPIPVNAGDDAHYEIDITYPGRLLVIGPGTRVLQEKKGRQRRVVYRTDRPRDDTTFYFGEYGKTEVSTDTLDVEYYYFKTDHTARGNARRVAREISRAVQFFSREFGPLDLATWRVTSFGTRNTRFLDGLVYRAIGTGNGTFDDFLQAHRVAHQWWGASVQGAHHPEDLWLEEALAYYAAMEYFEETYADPEKMWDILYKYMFRPLTEGFIARETLTGDQGKVLGRSMYPLINGTRNIYVKGPMVMRMLDYLFRVEKGEDALMAVLRDHHQSHRYQTTCTRDFQSIVEEALGENLGWFFQQWIREGGVPVIAWRQTIIPDGDEWVVRLEARQRQGRFRLLVPVYLHYPGGGVTVQPWTIDGESSDLTLRVPVKPVNVTLNDNFEALIIEKAL